MIINGETLHSKQVRNKRRSYESRWWHRLFPIQSSTAEDQIATIHRQDTIVKIPEPGGQAKAPPWLRRMALEGKEKQFHFDHIMPLPGQHRTAQRGLSPVEKQLDMDIQLPKCCWMLPKRPTGVSPHRDHWGWEGLQGSITGYAIDSEGERVFLVLTSAHILVNCIPGNSGREPSQQFCRTKPVALSGQGT